MKEPSGKFLKIAGDSSLRFASWNNQETVVYHCLSGDTHSLNPIAAAILKELESGSVERQGFPALLAHRLNYHEDDKFRFYVEEVVGELSKTGLVEIVT